MCRRPERRAGSARAGVAVGTIGLLGLISSWHSLHWADFELLTRTEEYFELTKEAKLPKNN